MGREHPELVHGLRNSSMVNRKFQCAVFISRFDDRSRCMSLSLCVYVIMLPHQKRPDIFRTDDWILSRLMSGFSFVNT